MKRSAQAMKKPTQGVGSWQGRGPVIYQRALSLS